eukprot:SAG31_NODE_876_length_11307_cov_3.506781_15_plen_195_part_00
MTHDQDAVADGAQQHHPFAEPLLEAHLGPPQRGPGHPALRPRTGAGWERATTQGGSGQGGGGGGDWLCCAGKSRGSCSVHTNSPPASGARWRWAAGAMYPRAYLRTYDTLDCMARLVCSRARGGVPTTLQYCARQAARSAPTKTYRRRTSAGPSGLYGRGLPIGRLGSVLLDFFLFINFSCFLFFLVILCSFYS